jgi:hypothetical protein
MRWRFWKLAVWEGWRWLSGVTDSLSRVLLLLALFGVPTAGAALLDLGWAAVAVGLVVVVAVALGEGAYRVWSGFAIDLGRRGIEDQNNAAFRGECFTWIGSVQKYLAARDALAPPQPKLATPLQGERDLQAREAGEAHERETVSIYIERHWDDAVALFERLVAGGYIGEKGGVRLRSPKSRWDIDDSTMTIQIAAERIPR